MEPNSNNSHPKPLAFTETSGASSLRRAVYRSATLWQYCVAMQESGRTPSANLLYNQYLNDADIVVLDDATYIDDTPSIASGHETISVQNQLGFDSQQEHITQLLRDLHINFPFPSDNNTDDNEDDDDE